jgi:class 3 adenylate cyclase/YHS domain-containing protein
VNSSSKQPSKTVEATFGFVDLAGFTALTETHGDANAADLAAGFFALTRSVLGEGDRLVKTIGDAVLVTSPTTQNGVRLVERLFNAVASDARFPSLRAGLNHGAAIERGGDVFGAAVNLAARVAAEAHAGEVLVTKELAESAEQLGVAVIEIGDVLLKNVKAQVKLYSLGFMLGDYDTPIDPVCHVPVDRRGATGYLQYRGREYWFCSLACAALFASNPAWHSAEKKP